MSTTPAEPPAAGQSSPQRSPARSRGVGTLLQQEQFSVAEAVGGPLISADDLRVSPTLDAVNAATVYFEVGSARLPASAAMVPLAPGRFSTGIGTLLVLGFGALLLIASLYIAWAASWIEHERVEGLYGYGLPPLRPRTSGQPGFGGFLRTLWVQFTDAAMWRGIGSAAIAQSGSAGRKNTHPFETARRSRLSDA